MNIVITGAGGVLCSAFSRALAADGHKIALLDLNLEAAEREAEGIRKAGGEAAMFREVLVWMRAVERACGKRPVLYVGQSFVNNHLNHAPEELRGYEVWIARYGEFKPYVRLLHWQLTPYGRVRGIRGEVDINVFNGTREQFEEKYPVRIGQSGYRGVPSVRPGRMVDF